MRLGFHVGLDARLGWIRPVARPRVEHGVRIRCSSETSVVTAQRTKEIAVFEIQVVTQYHAAITEIRAEVKKIVLAFAADELHPEGHHLHVASCARARQRVLAKT